MTAGNFDRDGVASLVIGVPFETVSGMIDAGVVVIITGELNPRIFADGSRTVILRAGAARCHGSHALPRQGRPSSQRWRRFRRSSTSGWQRPRRNRTPASHGSRPRPTSGLTRLRSFSYHPQEQTAKAPRRPRRLVRGPTELRGARHALNLHPGLLKVGPEAVKVM